MTPSRADSHRLACRSLGRAGVRTRAIGIAGVCGLCLVLAGCGVPTEKADCDELLNQQQWQKVLADCQKPSDRASAYLGLAGFSLTALLNSSTGSVIQIDSLTPGNLDQSRKYLELAVSAVNPPGDGSDAFALLLAAFLGMETLIEEYLDPALTGTVGAAQVTTAVGPTPQVPLVETAAPASAYFSVVVNGKPYLLDCTADVVNPVCTHATTKVFDDPDGSGRLTTAIASGSQSADKTTVLADVGSATMVGYPLEVFVVLMPVTFSVSATSDFPSFLGVSGGAGRFGLGFDQYLSGISAANNFLASAGGQPGGSTITTDISNEETEFDNGATCGIYSATFLSYLNGLYTLYASSAGTVAQPVPSGAGQSYFQAANYVSNSIFTSINNELAGSIPAIPAATYGFPNGTVTQYKVMFSTVAPGAPTFSADTATPRVDQGYAGFSAQYENIPVFGPNAAGDNKVSFAELTCIP